MKSISVIFIILFTELSKGSVVIKKLPSNKTIHQLLSADASFGPELELWGTAGYLMVSDPLLACSPITSVPANINNSVSLPMFVLIERGNCSFDVKVFNAQMAGFSAAIVYNNVDNGIFSMGKNSNTPLIFIPSVMVGLRDGLLLRSYLYPRYFVIINSITSFNPEAYIIPFLVVITVCFLLSGLLVLARICRDWRRRRRNRLTKSHLQKIPEKKFVKNEDPYETCAICLDDYLDGDKIRILPCSHAYHSACIDPWLLKNKRVCPVCKKKIHIPGAPRSSSSNSTDSSDSSQSESDNDSERTASESTHLLAGTSNIARNSGTFQNSPAPALVVVSVNSNEPNSSGEPHTTLGVENSTLQIDDESPTAAVSHPQSTKQDEESATDEVRISNERAETKGSADLTV